MTKLARESIVKTCLLWRFTPRRLEAEPIRDNLLAVSGRLDSIMFGAGTLDPNMRAAKYLFLHQAKPAHPLDDAL